MIVTAVGGAVRHGYYTSGAPTESARVVDDDIFRDGRASGCSQPQLRRPLPPDTPGPDSFMIGLHGRPKKAVSDCCAIGT